MKKVLLMILLVFTLGACGNTYTADDVVYVKSNEDAIMDDVLFTIEEMNTRKEVKPEKPSGYYHYYEEKDDSTYYVMTGIAKNHGLNNLDTENIIVQGVYNRKKYEGKLLFANVEESDFIKEIKSKETLKFYFVFLVNKGATTPDTIELFYVNDFRASDGNHFDKRIVWTVPTDEDHN